MEHPLHITTDGVWVFPETKEDSQQTGSQCGPWQEAVIQALTLKCEGAIEDYPVFAIVVHHVVWDEPRTVALCSLCR